MKILLFRVFSESPYPETPIGLSFSMSIVIASVTAATAFFFFEACCLGLLQFNQHWCLVSDPVAFWRKGLGTKSRHRKPKGFVFMGLWASA